MSKIVVITAENMASRLITESLIESLSDEISCVFILSNVPTSNKKEVKRFLRLLRKVSWHFLAYKFVEINIHNLMARLRGRTIEKTARKYGVPIKKYASPCDVEFFDELGRIQPDLLLSSGPVILPSEVLDIPTIATLNCHGGRLPEYQGVANYLWMMLDGVSVAHSSVQVMEAVIDAGPVIAETAISVGGDWSVHRLNYEVSVAGGKLYGDVARQVLMEGVPEKIQRPNAKPSYKGLPSSVDFARLRQFGKRLITFGDIVKYL